MDDSFEIIKKIRGDCFIHHLNRIDPTGSIKFTHEPELEKSIPILDAQITRKDDRTLKVKVYRKRHTPNQYPNFEYHHPLTHKLGDVRTLYEMADKIISEPEDQKQEIIHVNNALRVCGYRNWSFKEVRKRIDNRITKQKKEERRKKQKEESDGQNKIIVTIPHITGMSGAVECMLRRHGIATAVRPQKTLHQLLVHPKNKRSVQESAGVVYFIPCKDCPMVYMGVTGRRFGMRERAHKKDMKQLEGVNIRARRKESLIEIHQSVLTDHVMSKNHTIDLGGSETISKRTRLEEEMGERSHLHQEAWDARNQP